MTNETTHELNGLHRKQKRRAWIVVLITFVASALLFYAIGSFVHAGNERERETDRAVSAADQLCAQVETLGGLCVVDPADLRGEEGPAGPPGPPPSDEQVAEAVALILATNPPERGRPPTMQEIADAVAIHLAANPPQRGERGPAPTREQITNAVAAFLLANPPPAGPTGEPGEDGEDGEDGAPGADSTVPGPAGEPPLSWTFTTTDVLGQPTTHRCVRDEPFDPNAPTYTCAEAEE
ncbi:MAG: hypothetical protein GEV12_14380 [Micromonosporaceae bacterium]|nr:hypothetical protein [Micromonosporaceae bacterium]